MKFKFIDEFNINYEFTFRTFSLDGTPYLNVRIYNPPIQDFNFIADIIDKDIKWGRNDGIYYMHPSARRYIEKVIKNLAFC